MVQDGSLQCVRRTVPELQASFGAIDAAEPDPNRLFVVG